MIVAARGVVRVKPDDRRRERRRKGDEQDTNGDAWV
jgi:hypothetical protein